MSDEPVRSGGFQPMGVVMGAGIGVALGVALDSVALGAGIGAGVGMALALTLGEDRRASSTGDPEQDEGADGR